MLVIYSTSQMTGPHVLVTKQIYIKQTEPYLLRRNTEAGILTLSVPGLKQDLEFEAMTHIL